MIGLVSMFLTAPAAGGEVVLLAPGSAGWEHLRFPSVDRATEYRVLPEQGAVHAVSRCSASALVLPLDGIDPAATRATVCRLSLYQHHL